MENSLQLVLILLTLAVLVVVLCRIWNLPAMLGYLAVGIAIGPHALGWIPDTPQARHLGEFGVVFLMFSIGLEFSLAKLSSMRRTVFGLGGAQVGLTLLGVASAVILLGFGWRAGVALGGILAMSSTAIVSKMLVERAELAAPHGQQVMGVLLFQDLAVVPLLIIIPALASAPEALPMTLTVGMAKAGVVLLALLVFGQRMMRPWFHVVAQQKSSELFMLNVLLITLGLAYFTELAGLSMALGAFVAGMLIAETEYRYQVEDDIKPFRDVLLGLFFITIGMRLDLGVMLAEWRWVLLTLLAMLLYKAVLIAVLVRVFEKDWGIAIRTGMGLAQAGEFGFVLLTEAFDASLLPQGVVQIVLAAMLLSMLLAPFLIQHAEWVVRRLSPAEWMGRAMQMHQIAVQSMKADEHIILCGYGRSGQALGKFLKQEGIPFVALELDSRNVRQAVAEGDTVLYGDASKREVLLAAGLMRAKALVVTYADLHAALKILHNVRAVRPGLSVVVRTTDDSAVETLKKAGAAEVVAEVLEGSVMLASQALLLSGVPLNRVIRRIQENRARRYSVFSGYFRTTSDAPDVADINQPRIRNVLLGQDCGAVGKTLGELDLEGLHVAVNALRRDQERRSVPTADTVLQAGDVLMLQGQSEALTDAERRLREG
ncbi:MAG TPA: monovalent cation:proton antiporter-2 (CPA2) family protein [Gallionellaceae bacterium]|nr:monovalent cation:proton antiporter-2 (CPA2) family protein [Gallionellaceae bacterium]